MFDRIPTEEDGVAMIVALGVTFVVLLLSTVVVSQAIHNSQQSGYDRRRLTSVNGAEAGLNYFYNYVEKTPATSLSTAAVTQTLGTAPNATSFTVTPTFYTDTAGTTPLVGSPSLTNYPRSVRLDAVGTAGEGTTRRMESFVVLTPVFAGLEGALVVNQNATFTNNFTLNGNDGNDGDIYVLTGNFSSTSGNQTIRGDVWVTAGSATISANVHVYGEVWAGGAVPNGFVVVNHSQALIDSHAKSTNSSVTATSGTVTGNGYYCTGSAPGSNVQGQKIQTCSLGAPPTQAFPQIRYDQQAWEISGYWEKLFTGATACTDAKIWLQGNGAGQWQNGSVVPGGYTGAVVRITDTACTFGLDNNKTITLGKNLGIVSNGSINLSQQSNWNGSGSTKDLFFMSAWPASGSPSCPTQNVTIGNSTNFNSLVHLFAYSPCVTTMNNNNAFSGQVLGNTGLSITNNFNMTYKPILVPGAVISGFREDIAYIREVV